MTVCSHMTNTKPPRRHSAAFHSTPTGPEARSSSTPGFSRSPVAGTSSTIAAGRRLQPPSDPDSYLPSVQQPAPQAPLDLHAPRGLRYDHTIEIAQRVA